MGKFKRRYSPKCYVCHKELQDLIDLKWHKDNDRTSSDNYYRLKERVQRKIIFVGEYYRHNKADCEPGGKHYMKNEELVKNYIKNHGMHPLQGQREER
jgi:hypothetical protein|tara:strand:- start:16462 stop:16755 length:294 start_codon:yes stop_codon:yes gene_type:complete